MQINRVDKSAFCSFKGVSMNAFNLRPPKQRKNTGFLITNISNCQFLSHILESLTYKYISWTNEKVRISSSLFNYYYQPGADPCILTGYREVQPADEGCGEQVEFLEEGCGEEERIPIVKNHELSFMYPAARRFSVNLLAIFERWGILLVPAGVSTITNKCFTRNAVLESVMCNL